MSSKIKVLFLANGDLLTLLNKLFKPNDNYEIVGSISSVARLSSSLGVHKKLVLLMDASKNEQNLYDEVIHIAKSKNIKLLVICNNVKEGFVFLGKGADDMCTMPKDDSSIEIKSFFASLSMKVNKLYKDYDDNTRVLKNRFNKKIDKVIAIGSSTGGTECILRILKDLPADIPPVLIVQHMPPVFTRLYSKRLDNECKLTVWEAKDGDVLETGLALIAPGDQQMSLAIKNNRYVVSCKKEKPFNGHIPSVDVLFNSVANIIGKNGIGVILTGMGKDGADGLLKMRQKGAFTIGQDEQSSIVYGMPKIAYDIGAVSIQAKPEEIAKIIISKL